MSSNNFNIEKLKGRSNYSSWAFSMENYLQHEELWDGIIEEIPAAGPDDKKNMKALTKINMSLDSKLFNHVRGIKRASEAWESLKRLFQDDGLDRRVALVVQLVNTKLKNFPNIEDYVDQIMTVCHKLTEAGLKVTDEWSGIFMLAGLPSEYRPMILGMESSGKVITADAVKSKLLQDVAIVEHEENDVALYSKNRKKKFYKKKNFRENQENFHKQNVTRQPNRNGNKNFSLFSVLAVGVVDSTAWYIDSGATSHMTNSLNNFSQIEKFSDVVKTAGPDSIQVEGRGIVNLSVISEENEQISLTINNTLYVPNLATNLLSVKQITSKGLKVDFSENRCTIYNKNSIIAEAILDEGGLYKLKTNPKHHSLVSQTKNDIELWHRRLGHANVRFLQKMKQGIVTGIDFKESNVQNCVVCAKGKQAKLPFKEEGHRANELLELVHSDLCGPMESESFRASRYFLTFICDKSRKIFIYFLQYKSQVLESFKDFKTRCEKQSGKKIKILRTDNGGEYCSKEFENYLSSQGIDHQLTIPYTPEQNGLAERYNRTIIEKTRCLLFDAKLPKQFWAEAANTAVYLINRSPTTGLNITPEEAWSGKKPNLSHLRVFGSKVMLQIPKEKRHKLDPKSQECILTGYGTKTKGYRLYSPETQTFLFGRNVIFLDEAPTGLGGLKASGDSFKNFSGPNVVSLELSTNFSEEIDTNDQSSTHESAQNGFNYDIYTDDEESDDVFLINQSFSTEIINSSSSDNEEQIPVVRRSERLRNQAPKIYNEKQLAKTNQNSNNCLVMLTSKSRQENPQDKSNNRMQFDAINGANFSPSNLQLQSGGGREILGKSPKSFISNSLTNHNNSQVEDPITFKQALESPNKDLWIEAMKDEYKSLVENGTWSLCELPKGRKAIKNKWIFKTKRDSNGNIDRYKARLVVKGCSQKFGIDYQEIFSPVVRYQTIRYLMALAVQKDLKIHQMDAVTAFLQGELNDEEIFMDQPEGFIQEGNLVCKLNKALYGLKQSSRVWNLKLDAALKKFGFQQSNMDPCMYFIMKGNKILIVTIYVDDFLIFFNDEKMLKNLKTFLTSNFKMKDLGEAEYCLGIKITRNFKSGKLWLDQENYIRQIFEKFNMTDCKTVSTPTDPSVKLTKSKSNDPSMKNVPYQEAIGSLLFLAQVSRPDISYAVHVVSQFSNNPNQSHWTAVKRIFRYLKGTSNFKLEYSKHGSNEVIGYSDADWGANEENRKSISGYIFQMAGGPISWKCSKQESVALSSCEAEYIAMSLASQEAIFWYNFQQELKQTRSVTINCDNQSAMVLASNNGYSPRTKHISIRYHFIREAIQKGFVNVCYVQSNLQKADILTKGLQKSKHSDMCKLMNLNIMN